MTDPMTPEYLAEIEQRFASGRVVNVVTQRALLAEVRRLQAAATPTEPIEPLPEYMHQSLPIASLRRAIELLELAKSTDKPQDRLELLRRADAQTMYARDTAKSAMARWRHWNKQACTLGFLATYGPPPDPPVLDGQDPLI